MFDGLRSWLAHLAGRQTFFPHQMAFILELPLRRLLVTPAQLADRLQLTERTTVLEVGCGSGVFSVEVARRLPRGHLELFDLQPEMLAKARRKIEAAGLAGVVGYTQGDASRLALPTAAFDVAFMVAVLGEVPEPRACLAALHRVLRPGGLLSITEHLPDPDFSRVSTLRSLVEAEGFEFVERFGPAWSYTANFRRPARRFAVRSSPTRTGTRFQVSSPAPSAGVRPRRAVVTRGASRSAAAQRARRAGPDRGCSVGRPAARPHPVGN